MRLVEALAAGIAGCEGGTATLVYRGTASPATYYTDFEGTASVTSGAVALDARGGVVIYVADLVTIAAKSSGGATIRTFTSGDDDGAVEIRSASFNGAAYVGGAVAPGNPTTLKAVADKWFTSAGAVDWNVLFGGVSTTLQSALASAAGRRVYSVKTYGAVGDGVANDLTAINAAATAANAAGGGIVFFPPGTYLASATLASYATVEYVGAGASLSAIRMTADAPPFNAGASFPRRIADLSFSTSVSGFTCWVSAQSGAGNSIIQDCVFPNTSASFYGNGAFRNFSPGKEMRITRCSMGMGIGADRLFSLSGDGATMIVEDCSIVQYFATGWFASVSGTAANATFVMDRCKIDCSGNGGQSMPGIALSNYSTAYVRGCKLVSATGTSAVVNLIYVLGATSVYFFESDNDYTSAYSFLEAAAPANKSPYGIATNPTYGVRGTWASAVVAPDSPNGATITLFMLSAARHVIRTTGGSGTRAIACDSVYALNGEMAALVVHNDTGASITYQWSVGFASAGATFAVAANSVRTFTFIYDRERLKWFIVSDLAGAETLE